MYSHIYSICVYIYMYMHTCVYIYICVCVCTYIHMCIVWTTRVPNNNIRAEKGSELVAGDTLTPAKQARARWRLIRLWTVVICCFSVDYLVLFVNRTNCRRSLLHLQNQRTAPRTPNSKPTLSWTRSDTACRRIARARVFIRE